MNTPGPYESTEALPPGDRESDGGRQQTDERPAVIAWGVACALVGVAVGVAAGGLVVDVVHLPESGLLPDGVIERLAGRPQS